MTEAQLQEQVADYLRLQYPDVLFHSDFGSGIKLTPGQAARQKRQNGGRRAWPDMFIAEVTICGDYHDWHRLKDWMEVTKEISDEIVDFHPGLFLELKKEGTRLTKKKGEWATDHIAEQAEVIERLRKCGYCAEFAVGFDEAKKIIDAYLGG